MTSESFLRIIADVLDHLTMLDRERVRPPDAQQRFRPLQSRHPDAELQLVWHEEAYDGSVAYDVLLRLDERATVSLGFSPDRGLAWPLRGVQRWSERDLLRVNGQLVEVEDAILFLDCLWNHAPIMRRLIHSCLAREELAREPIEIDDRELQVGLDAFRRKLGLLDVNDMRQWMEQRGLTHDKLEKLVEDNLRVDWLRERRIGARVTAYFEEHRRDFDTVDLARIQYADEAVAHRVRCQILGGQIDFWEAAEGAFGAVPERAAPLTLQTVRYRDCPVEQRRAIFDAATGDVLDPMPCDDGHAVVRILRSTRARLDEVTTAAVKAVLFEEWLEERRRTARIEWNWGRANDAT